MFLIFLILSIFSANERLNIISSVLTKNASLSFDGLALNKNNPNYFFSFPALSFSRNLEFNKLYMRKNFQTFFSNSKFASNFHFNVHSSVFKKFLKPPIKMEFLDCDFISSSHITERDNNYLRTLYVSVCDTVLISDTVFDGCSSSTETDIASALHYGGALCFSKFGDWVFAQIDISRCTFNNCYVSEPQMNAGAIYSTNINNLDIRDCTFFSCHTTSYGIGGALLLVDSGSVRIQSSTFDSCFSVIFGSAGAISIRGARYTEFSRLTFRNCHSSYFGGAIQTLDVENMYIYKLFFDQCYTENGFVGSAMDVNVGVDNPTVVTYINGSDINVTRCHSSLSGLSFGYTVFNDFRYIYCYNNTNLRPLHLQFSWGSILYTYFENNINTDYQVVVTSEGNNVYYPNAFPPGISNPLLSFRYLCIPNEIVGSSVIYVRGDYSALFEDLSVNIGSGDNSFTIDAVVNSINEYTLLYSDGNADFMSKPATGTFTQSFAFTPSDGFDPNYDPGAGRPTRTLVPLNFLYEAIGSSPDAGVVTIAVICVAIIIALIIGIILSACKNRQLRNYPADENSYHDEYNFPDFQ